jgi:hypothetical protein
MAKHYSKRASKKRAYKKRRTIRKLKTTLRRKMQRGGGDEEALMIKLILQLVPQVMPIIIKLIDLGDVKLLMSILTLLSGNPISVSMGGIHGGSMSNNRQTQQGGMPQNVKDRLLEKIGALSRKFAEKADKQHLVDCMAKITQKINEQQAEPTSAATPDSTSEVGSLENELKTDTTMTVSDTFNLTPDLQFKEQLKQNPPQLATDTLPEQATLNPAVEEAAKRNVIKQIIDFFNNRIKNNITGKIDVMIDNIRNNVGTDVIDCLKMLKAEIVADIETQIRSKMGELSSAIFSKVNSVMGSLFQFLIWSTVQIAIGNRSAVLKEGARILSKIGLGAVTARVDAVTARVDAVRANAKGPLSMFFRKVETPVVQPQTSSSENSDQQVKPSRFSKFEF